MLSLIVKGTRYQAARAAADRGIPFAYVRETDTETVGHVDSAHRDRVLAWFTEPGAPPYPAGSLLLYHDEEQGADIAGQQGADI